MEWSKPFGWKRQRSNAGRLKKQKVCESVCYADCLVGDELVLLVADAGQRDVTGFQDMFLSE
jgi:hypothetical protein